MQFTVDFSSSPHFLPKGNGHLCSSFRKKIACGAPRKATFASSPYGVGAAQPACQTPPSASTPVTPGWVSPPRDSIHPLQHPSGWIWPRSGVHGRGSHGERAADLTAEFTEFIAEFIAEFNSFIVSCGPSSQGAAHHVCLQRARIRKRHPNNLEAVSKQSRGGVDS